MKRILLGFVAALALMMPFAAEKADAQVVVQYGPRYHHRYYRDHYYHRAYYHHGYYHRRCYRCY